MMTHQQAMADAARGMVGTPFHHQGRVPGVALDCVGVAMCAAWAAGIHVADISGYGRSPNDCQMRHELAQRCLEVAEPQSGDVVLFALHRGQAQHLAVIDGQHIIHAVNGRNVVRQEFAPRWRKRVDSYWRPREGDAWQR